MFTLPVYLALEHELVLIASNTYSDKQPTSENLP